MRAWLTTCVQRILAPPVSAACLSTCVQCISMHPANYLEVLLCGAILSFTYGVYDVILTFYVDDPLHLHTVTAIYPLPR